MKRFFAMLIGVLMLAGCGAGSEATQPKNGAKTEAASGWEKSLAITPEEFRSRVNLKLEEIDQPFHINHLNVDTSGKVSTFKYTLSERIVFVGSVTKSGELNSITMIAQGDGTPMSGLHMFGVAWAISSALSPDKQKAEISNLVLRLMKSDQDHKADGTETVEVVGKVRYAASISQAIGFWFTAGPVEN